jgi:hypothetical protein
MEYRYLLSPLLFRITLKTCASTVTQDKKYKDSDWKGRVKTVLWTLHDYVENPKESLENS